MLLKSTQKVKSLTSHERVKALCYSSFTIAVVTLVLIHITTLSFFSTSQTTSLPCANDVLNTRQVLSPKFDISAANHDALTTQFRTARRRRLTLGMEDRSRANHIALWTGNAAGLAVAGVGVGFLVDMLGKTHSPDVYGTDGALFGPLMMGMGFTLILLTWFITSEFAGKSENRTVTVLSTIGLLWAGGLATTGCTLFLTPTTTYGETNTNEILGNKNFGPEQMGFFFCFASGFGAFLLTWGVWQILGKIPSLQGPEPEQIGNAVKWGFTTLLFAGLTTTGVFASIVHTGWNPDLALGVGISGVFTATVFLTFLAWKLYAISDLGQKAGSGALLVGVLTFVGCLGFGSAVAFNSFKPVEGVENSEAFAEAGFGFDMSISIGLGMITIAFAHIMLKYTVGSSKIVSAVTGLGVTAGGILLSLSGNSVALDIDDGVVRNLEIAGPIVLGSAVAIMFAYLVWKWQPLGSKLFSKAISVVLSTSLAGGVCLLALSKQEVANFSEIALPCSATLLATTIFIGMSFLFLKNKSMMVQVSYVTAFLGLGGSLIAGFYQSGGAEISISDLTFQNWGATIIAGWVALAALILAGSTGKPGDEKGTATWKVLLGVVPLAGIGCWTTLEALQMVDVKATINGGECEVIGIVWGSIIGIMAVVFLIYWMGKRLCGSGK